MKKWNIFLYMIVLVSTISCTITKRHHQPGFHVEWKKHISKKPNHEVKRVDTLSTLALGVPQLHEQEIAAVSPISSPPALPVPVTQAEPPRFLESTSRHQTQTDSHLKIDEEPLVTTQPMDELELKDVEDEKPARKTEPLTWVALAVFLGIGLAAILIYMYSSFTYLGTGIFLSGLALVFFILSLISFIRIKKHPERYKYKTFTTVIFFLSCLTFTVGVFYLLLTIAIDDLDVM